MRLFAIRCLRWVCRMAGDGFYALDEWLLGVSVRYGAKSWVVHPLDDEVHVMPENDDIVHDFTECVCGPDISDDDERPLVKHWSLDGREKRERVS